MVQHWRKLNGVLLDASDENELASALMLARCCSDPPPVSTLAWTGSGIISGTVPGYGTSPGSGTTPGSGPGYFTPPGPGNASFTASSSGIASGIASGTAPSSGTGTGTGVLSGFDDYSGGVTAAIDVTSVAASQGVSSGFGSPGGPRGPGVMSAGAQKRIPGVSVGGAVGVTGFTTSPFPGFSLGEADVDRAKAVGMGANSPASLKRAGSRLEVERPGQIRRMDGVGGDGRADVSSAGGGTPSPHLEA